MTVAYLIQQLHSLLSYRGALVPFSAELLGYPESRQARIDLHLLLPKPHRECRILATLTMTALVGRYLRGIFSQSVQRALPGTFTWLYPMAIPGYLLHRS